MYTVPSNVNIVHRRIEFVSGTSSGPMFAFYRYRSTTDFFKRFGTHHENIGESTVWRVTEFLHEREKHVVGGR